MKTMSSKFLVVAVSAVLCGSAFAAEQKAHDPMAGASTKDPIQAEMKLMDTDQDGKISAAEHATGSQEMFKGMDGNQDSRVSAAEMDATQPALKSQDAAHGATHGKSHAMSSTDKIKAVDGNGDGFLTAQEHEAGAKKMFTKMDKDKDGFLTSAELKDGHQQLMMSQER